LYLGDNVSSLNIRARLRAAHLAARATIPDSHARLSLRYPAIASQLEPMKPLLNKKNEIEQILLSFKSTFYTVGVFSAITNLLMLAPSLYMLQVYDRVLQSRNEITLLMLTLMMLGAYVLLGALELIRSYVLVRVGAQFDMKLNRRVYTAAFEQNLKQLGGNAGQSLQDLTTIRQFLTGNALFAFFDAPWFPIYLLVIFLFEPVLGLFALGGTIVLVILAVVNEKVTKKPMAEANSMAIAASALSTSLTTVAPTWRPGSPVKMLSCLFSRTISSPIAV